MSKRRKSLGLVAQAEKILGFFAQLFDNLSIRTKLFVYAGTIIALMTALAIFEWQQSRIIQEQQLPARVAIREVESAILTMRINEQQFMNDAESLNTELYVKQKNNSITAWQESYRQFEANYDTVSSLYKDTELQQHLQVIQSQMVQYRDAFLNLVATYEQRGFQSFGREGALQLRADTLQNALEGKAQAQNTMLKLRHAQDSFLLHKDIVSIDSFDNYADQLNKQLTTPADKTTLEEYAHLFHEVVDLDKKIGLTTNDGIRGRLNNLIAGTYPHVQAAGQYVFDSTDAQIAIIFQSINVSTIVLGLVATTMAIIIARFILRRIEQLLGASRQIMAGDLEYRLPIQSTDELGRLALSFNNMTEKLQKVRQTLHQRATALSESVKRFELVSRAVNEAIYERDLLSDTLEWGEGLITVFGYRPEDKNTHIEWWTSRIHPDDTQIVNDSLNERTQRQAATWKAVYRFKKANGQYAYCQDNGFIEYRHKQPIRMVGSLVDITRQIELDQAKDEFISIASHQLRTPLGSIRWNLELLLEEAKKLPTNMRVYVQEAYNSTLRMGGLVGDLLSVARIEQNRVQDMPAQTDIVAIIMMAVSEMHPIAKQRRIHINTTQLKQKHIEIVIDPKRFREVIQNLLSNAVKYSNPGRTVTVGVANTREGIVIGIADSGIGIPAEDQSKLFTKFFRAKNVTTTDTEGSGLGLFVVKSYVESWGGRIWFTSKVNKGTTFYISIPNKPSLHKTKS